MLDNIPYSATIEKSHLSPPIGSRTTHSYPSTSKSEPLRPPLHRELNELWTPFLQLRLRHQPQCLKGGSQRSGSDEGHRVLSPPSAVGAALEEREVWRGGTRGELGNISGNAKKGGGQEPRMRAGHEVRLWPGAAVGWQQALRSKGELDVTEGGREREGERNKAEIL